MKKSVYKTRWLQSWELALLLALCVSVTAAAWAERRGAELSSSMVRLHVIASSDAEYEQALKLRVRDEVLEYLAPRLEGADTAAEAAEVIRASLAGVERSAQSAAEGREIAVTLGRERYPTRRYEGFALPAGEYTSLRVTIGEGGGQNWWCVVFPPLCLSAAEGGESMEALSPEDAALITEDGYIIKFKLVELWGELKNALA